MQTLPNISGSKTAGNYIKKILLHEIILYYTNCYIYICKDVCAMQFRTCMCINKELF